MKTVGYSLPVMPSSSRRFVRRGPIRSRIAAAALLSLGLCAVPGTAAADDTPGNDGTAANSGTISGDSTDVVGGPRLAEQGRVVTMAPGVPALPATTATSFVVADADTGAVLASLNAHQKLAPASTLKTLTAVTLLPRLSPNSPTVAQSDAPSADGTKAGIVAGTTYKVDDLFTAMLMMSANDAAVALADANGGLATTLAEMNAEAAHLQADDTVARTPNGLDARGQSSSAYDLALIFRAGLADARFRHYLALTRAPFPAPGGKAFEIQTHDKLLQGYPGMVGGKNGYTVAAQASYVGAASRKGHTIIVAVMRDQPNFWSEVKALLDWGFAADGVASSVGVLVGPGQPKPSHSAAPSTNPTTAPDSIVGGAAGGGNGVSATTAKIRSSGVGLANVTAWTAVGIGALVFLWALAQALARRRRRGTRDDRYREGLSRLSTLGEVSDGS